MTPEMVDILVKTGASAEQIAELWKADMAERERQREAKREGNAERQKRFRENHPGKRYARNKRNALPAVTPPIEDHTPVPDISSDDESQSQSATCEPAVVLKSWNVMAGAHSLGTCSKMDGKRLRSCRARLRDTGLDAIQRAIQHIPKSQFLLGQTGNWSASIDWLLKPDSVTHILEGKYDDRPKPQLRAVGGTSPDRRSSLARAIDEGLDWLDGAQAGVS